MKYGLHLIIDNFFECSFCYWILCVYFKGFQLEHITFICFIFLSIVYGIRKSFSIKM